MRQTLVLLVLALFSFGVVKAQDQEVGAPMVEVNGEPYVRAATVQHDHLRDDFATVTNLSNVAPAAFILASVAHSATDWTFTGPITGREYHVSAKRQVAITGAAVGGALVIRHLFPKTRKWVDTILLISAGAYAGSAYANAQAH